MYLLIELNDISDFLIIAKPKVIELKDGINLIADTPKRLNKGIISIILLSTLLKKKL